jgi:hypothetical protein
MNIVRGGRLAAFATLCSLASVSAHANFLNIPAAQATPSYESTNCGIYAINGYFALTQQPEFCKVEFPLLLPAGSTIKQITVVHGTSYPLLPQPTISASLRTLGNNSLGSQTISFNWSSTTPVPNDVLLKSNLMAQFGKLYPDAFIVQSDTMYQVEVSLADLSFVTGVQVTYD